MIVACRSMIGTYGDCMGAPVTGARMSRPCLATISVAWRCISWATTQATSAEQSSRFEQPLGRVINRIIPAGLLAVAEPVRRVLEIAFREWLMTIEPLLTRISTKDF